MLAGILFLVLVLAVAVLITLDVVRTPAEAPAGQPDRPAYDAERPMAGARGGSGAHAYPRDPAAREKSVPPAPVATRFAGAGPAEVDSFTRPEETAQTFEQARRETPQPAVGDAALRGKFNAMYLNLSRRSQALVERQLRLIEGLQHGEQDRQRQASLTRLNRLAMRIHRNSQNILVLAGQETAPDWNHPVTLAHLVEAALAEVEDYERVSFEVQPDIAVRGPAVHDAVHLLVELIDNATSFSAADMPVRITGRILSSGGALIDITDRGIGMPANEMAYANQQLDNPPAPDIGIPKWMGLPVVARLAARHGIRVRLNQADLGGLTALVWFPDEVLTHYNAAVDPGHVAVGERAAAVGPAGYAPARMPAPDGPATGPDPAWSGRGRQAAVPAEPLAAARLSGPPDAPGGDLGVVVPRAETPRRLPIFDEVESRWSHGGRESSGPVGVAAAPAPAPSGLPRRPPPTAAGPRPSARPSWATPPDEPNPGPDES
jgi:hypothetical protein